MKTSAAGAATFGLMGATGAAFSPALGAVLACGGTAAGWRPASRAPASSGGLRMSAVVDSRVSAVASRTKVERVKFMGSPLSGRETATTARV
ncbi:hypothetical protein AEGHOMDF_4934 [Methylobacterium soli]|nr:hypothetical protein AEGHOMDF_4934 [Methylobacterium soli]